MLSMQQSIDIMKNQIVDILNEDEPSIYLYGSFVLDDFRLGWSDIDILCLAQSPITQRQADQLVNLRQRLLEMRPNNPYFRLFEGGFLSLKSFIEKSSDIVVYWGTSGQRITDRYLLGAFPIMELIDSGVLLHGQDVREKMSYPTSDEIRLAVMEHYHAIRQYAVQTTRSLYSAGWLLDIARCLYSLQTGKIIAKTVAGEWALANALVPDVDVMQRVIEIRKEPIKYRADETTLAWLETLGGPIQRFADVLEKQLFHPELNTSPNPMGRGDL